MLLDGDTATGAAGDYIAGGLYWVVRNGATTIAEVARDKFRRPCWRFIGTDETFSFVERVIARAEMVQ